MSAHTGYAVIDFETTGWTTCRPYAHSLTNLVMLTTMTRQDITERTNYELAGSRQNS